MLGVVSRVTDDDKWVTVTLVTMLSQCFFFHKQSKNNVSFQYLSIVSCFSYSKYKKNNIVLVISNPRHFLIWIFCFVVSDIKLEHKRDGK